MAKFDYKVLRDDIEEAVDRLIDKAYDVVDEAEKKMGRLEDEVTDDKDEIDSLKKELAGALNRVGYLERRLAEAQKCGFSEN
jgi:chromosome segregation ATPase